jgi:hypothetical protein
MNAPRSLAAILISAAALLLIACTVGGSPTPPPSPTPSPTPSSTPAPTQSQAALKYALLARFGPISWCDPDFYPIAHEDEQVLAQQRLPEIQRDAETFAAIREHLDLLADKALTDAEVLAVYRDWKLLRAVSLSPVGEDVFSFDLITETNVGLGQGVHTTGTIDTQGTIEIAAQEDGFLTSCPICLARGTMIDTPIGFVSVESLQPGDLVWTVDSAGNRAAMPLLRTASTPVPASHQVVHLVLDDGRELWVSPGHPLTDGRTAGDLRATDLIDRARVVIAELTRYSGGATFDILPGGGTGFYWANGILIASTLTRG